jgi:two-component system cell cycle sensor histidine kinase PleC
MFGYLRLFSILSLLGVIAIALLSGMSLRSLATQQVEQLVEKNNTGLAQGYVNSVWGRYRAILVPLIGEPQKLAQEPQIVNFAQETQAYFQHLPLARFNVYTATGTLLISADLSAAGKIAGKSASPDPLFFSRRLNEMTAGSNLVQAPLQNGLAATLVQTVMPIQLNGHMEGLVEIVSDVTFITDGLERFQIFCTGAIIAVFLMVLGILYLTSKRAEGIIAKQHEANLELAAAAAAAQAENRDKSQFLANISHELRTPLNAIIGFSDILKSEALPQIQEQKYHDYINDIYASGVHLLSLINDILDFSKAEAGKLELEVSEVNASKTVSNCLRLVQQRALTGQVRLIDECPKDEIILHIDGKKFKQIMLNLLSNAVKFTPSGGSVSVTAWHNLGDDSFTFEVIDSGIGIAPKDISRAMSPFGQVDNTLKRKYEGTGLGLPLTKKLVELMGGKFMIESKVGTGTKITFTLPREVKAREGLVIKQAS